MLKLQQIAKERDMFSSIESFTSGDEQDDEDDSTVTEVSVLRMNDDDSESEHEVDEDVMPIVTFDVDLIDNNM